MVKKVIRQITDLDNRKLVNISLFSDFFLVLVQKYNRDEKGRRWPEWTEVRAHERRSNRPIRGLFWLISGLFLDLCFSAYFRPIFGMCVCLRSRDRNFCPIVTKFGTQVGLVKSKVEFEDGLCRSHIDLQGHHQNTKIWITF